MQTHAHIHAQEKAQTSLLLIYAQGPSNLPVQSNKQQRNLRRYDITPAKNSAASIIVIPVGIYRILCLDWN